MSSLQQTSPLLEVRRATQPELTPLEVEMDMENVSALTHDEQEMFNALGGLVMGKSDDWAPALMRAMYQGRPVAVIVAVSKEDDEGDLTDYAVRPLAVMVNEEILDELEPPHETPETS